MKIYPYNQGSASAKALAEALGAKRIKVEGKPLKTKGVLLNWGASQFRRNLSYDRVINTPQRVGMASNKLSAFKRMEGSVSIPKWTESRDEAVSWLNGENMVVCRTLLTGHSGAGIVLASEEQYVVDAPLYVAYIPKKEEYRLHVMHGEVFFTQKKMRKLDVPDDDVNWAVRNHANGFIYANQGVFAAPEAINEALKAIIALGLDFGAVDIIWNARSNKFYVLEVNTAPGLTGGTIVAYVEQLKRYL